MLCIIVTFKVWIDITNLESSVCDKKVYYRDIKSVRVLSFNMFMRSWCFGDHKNKRLDVFINNYLKDFDIVCLQEMFGVFTFRCHNLIKIAKKMGFKYSVVPSNPSLSSKKLIDSGLVILSRYNILEHKFIPYKDSIYVDKYAEKGFQHCKISINGYIIDLINTHIQASYKIDDDIGDRVKFLQIEQLGKYIEKCNNPLVCGDMNCDGNNDKYGLLLKLLKFKQKNDLIRLFSKSKIRPFTTYCMYDKETGNETGTWLEDPVENSICIPQSIDYIFYKNTRVFKCIDAKVNQFAMKNSYVSDHFGVEATFKLK
jgi:endonuclease/exonuclease/phosphatase family metal-dependent hydrolase